MVIDNDETSGSTSVGLSSSPPHSNPLPSEKPKDMSATPTSVSQHTTAPPSRYDLHLGMTSIIEEFRRVLYSLQQVDNALPAAFLSQLNTCICICLLKVDCYFLNFILRSFMGTGGEMRKLV